MGGGGDVGGVWSAALFDCFIFCFMSTAIRTKRGNFLCGTHRLVSGYRRVGVGLCAQITGLTELGTVSDHSQRSLV